MLVINIRQGYGERRRNGKRGWRLGLGVGARDRARPNAFQPYKAHLKSKKQARWLRRTEFPSVTQLMRVSQG
jgi:hypothetical protein